MADIVVSPVAATRAGAAITPRDATTTDTFYIPNNGRVHLFFDNRGTGHAATTYKLETFLEADGLDLEDLSGSIADDVLIASGGFRPDVYNDGDGRLKLTFGANSGGCSFWAVQD